MTVYVDEIRTYPRSAIKGAARRWGTKWCHMFSDEEDKSELHEIAQRIGHKSNWFQGGHKQHIFDHYDLVPTRRELAIKAGVTETSFRELIRKVLLNGKQ